jgi:hypothetical protein
MHSKSCAHDRFIWIIAVSMYIDDVDVRFAYTLFSRFDLEDVPGILCLY